MAPLEVIMECRPGGAYRFKMTPSTWIEGVYQEITPPKRLVFTWIYLELLDDGAERRTMDSLVTVTLEDMDGGTELTLLHENLSAQDGRDGVTIGWTESFEKLEEVLRPVDPRGFGSKDQM